MLELGTATLLVLAVTGCGIAVLPWTDGELGASVGAFRTVYTLTLARALRLARGLFGRPPGRLAGGSVPAPRLEVA